jgi:hypothetical protein
VFIEFEISKGLLSEQRMPQGPLSLNLLYQPCQRHRLLAADFRLAIPASAATGAAVYCNVTIGWHIKVSNLRLTTF